MRLSLDRFLRALPGGLDTDHPRLDRALTRAGLTPGAADRLDTDGDGALRGAELAALHEALTDAGGRAATTTTLRALRRAALRPDGEAIAASARWLATGPGRGQYALASRYDSPNPKITGSYEGRWKCNLFAGDALAGAGFEPPTHPVGAGRHYQAAERWRDSPAFRVVADRERLRPGDVLLFDDPEDVGAEGAHLEIVTAVERDAAGRLVRVVTAGGRMTGGAEDERYGARLLEATPAGDRLVDAVGDEITILRPRRRGEALVG